jgi:hypothetical protein
MATGVAERVDGPQVIACVRETFSTATRKAAKRAR